MMVTFETKTGKSIERLKTKAPILLKHKEVRNPNINDRKTPIAKESSKAEAAIQIIEDGKDFFKFRQTKRSRNGCLTCKVRKKKCDETKPVCQDCSRLNKECIWIDHKRMSEDEIRTLKEKAEKDEENSKIRKRKFKGDASSNKSKKTQYNIFIPRTGIASKSAQSNKSGTTRNGAQTFVVNNTNTAKQDYTLKSQIGFSNTLDNLSTVHSKSSKSDTEYPIIISRSPSIETYTSEDLHDLKDIDDDSPPPLELYTSNFSTERPVLSPSTFIQLLRDLPSPKDEPNVPERQTRPEQSDAISPNYSALIESLGHELIKSPLAYDDILQSLNIDFNPIPNPSLFPDLSNTGNYLLNYYVDELSSKVSISPSSQDGSNSYRNIFLPLAHKDRGVLYGLLAWAGFHLGGEWKVEGEKYVEMALDHLFRSGGNTIATMNDDRDSVRTKLATLLILCGAEICKGDVKNWSLYLSWGFEIFNNNGGILNFNHSTQEYWLVSNFAYHDLLASSTCERGTYYPMKDYQMVFEDPHGFSKGKLSPVFGVSKNLYKIIGDINILAFKSRRYFDEYYDGRSSQESSFKENGDPSAYDDDTSDALSEDDTSPFVERGGKSKSISKFLRSVIAKAKELESLIENSKPNPHDLENMTDKELEWQLTIFEAFQLSSKLFLRQSIMRCNPSSLESQLLYTDLIKCIDIIMETDWRTTLVFPVFIAGLHCVTIYDRNQMRMRIDKFIKLYGPWNVSRVGVLLERVWKDNFYGDKFVDWYAILKELRWDLNFA